jgi:methionyl-tRNA formyltransferase
VRLFIAGSRAFGAEVLTLALRKGHEVLGVSSPALGSGSYSDGAPKPDRLRAAAEAAGVPWMLAGTLSAETLPDGVDLIVAAHSHDFIGRKTRLRAAGGAIGYHPSLLPLHRGRDAVRWAVHMGDRVTGGSIYVLSDNVDAGPVLAQEHVFVRPDDTAEALWRRELFPLGVRLFDQVLSDLASVALGGALDEIEAYATAQDEALATWEPSWERTPLRRPDLLLLRDGH